MRSNLDLGSDCVEVRVDHYTFYFELDRLSIHYLEKIADPSGEVGALITSKGSDIDMIQASELGVTGDFSDGITKDKILEFVSSLTTKPVKLDLKDLTSLPAPE